MVHIYCQNDGCRMMLHLDDAHYWNYKAGSTVKSAAPKSRLKSKKAK